MTLMLRKGRYTVRLAIGPGDVETCQRLRGASFLPGAEGLDCDAFDPLCQHVMIEDWQTGHLVCCYRFMLLPDAAAVARSYAAQHYDLSALAAQNRPMMEMGRFCIAGGRLDADIIRMAWGALAQFVTQHEIEVLFGCSSFSGTDPAAYLDAFELLRRKYAAPSNLAPRPHAMDIVPFAPHEPFDRVAALAQLPPLLRSYLSMGGWVSDHAVVDHQLQTLHVFTALDVAAVPNARVKSLMAAAG